MRKLLVIVAALGLVLAGPTSAASAVEATSGPVQAVEVPDFTPSPTKWREFMLNVTSKMLRGASGGRVDLTGSWRAEQIANQHRYAPSAEQLNRMYMNSSYNPNFATAPDSFEDYMLKESTRATKNGGRALKVQATPMQKFIKGVNIFGGATLVPLIGGLGSDVVGGWMGVDDVDNELCSAHAAADNKVFTTVFGVLSGRSCVLFGFDSSYVANGDAGVSWSSAAGYFYLGSVVFLGGPVHCYYAAGAHGANSEAGQLLWVSSSQPGGWAIMGGGKLPPAGSSGAGAVCKSSFPSTSHFHATAPDPNNPGLRVVSSGGVTVEEMTSSHSDPERYMECAVTLDDGTVLTAEGEPYKESSGGYNPPACPSVPAGKSATNITVTEKSVGGSVAPQTVYNENVTPEYTEWSTSYPECAEGACALDLHMKIGNQLGQSCFDIAEGCPDWWEDPSKADNYQCTYGANRVDIDECVIYAGLFKPGRVEAGGAYSDPMTGDWSGGSNSVTLDRQAMGQRVQNPAETRTCNGMHTGGFDPVGFVMRPIQCALEWAFVPRPLVVEASLAGGGQAWDGKPPAVIAAAVANAAPVAAVEGCSRTVTIFAGEFETAITPLDACPGSWSAPLATISQIATAGIMAVLVFVVVRRQISGMVGYNQGQ